MSVPSITQVYSILSLLALTLSLLSVCTSLLGVMLRELLSGPCGSSDSLPTSLCAIVERTAYRTTAEFIRGEFLVLSSCMLQLFFFLADPNMNIILGVGLDAICFLIGSITLKRKLVPEKEKINF